MASAPRQQDRWSTPRGGEKEPSRHPEAMTHAIFVVEHYTLKARPPRLATGPWGSGTHQAPGSGRPHGG